VAGIYNIATLDAVRGRGIGAAMTLHAAGHAAGEGYAIAVLASSQMGLPIYRRLGFQPVCRLRFLVRPPGHRPHGRAHRPVAGKATRISP
jgi:GNAT superfamily N-acetyltransferase